MWLSDHNTNIFIPLLHMSQVDTLTEHHTTMNIIQQLNILHDVAWSSIGYKITALVAHWHSDSYTTRSHLI